MFFDAHMHIEPQGTLSPREVIERAQEAGVTRMLAVGGSEEANRLVIEWAQCFPDHVRAAIGFDRDAAPALASTPRRLQAAMEELLSLAQRHPPFIAAIGEIGLDFHHHPETASLQIGLLEAQLEVARQLQLPIVLHSRESESATLRAVRRHASLSAHGPGHLGMLHSFAGSLTMAQEAVEVGFHISFSGIVTFARAWEIRDVAAWVPADRLLAETDSPYLAPVPHRGKRNEPARLPHILETLAVIRGVTRVEVGALTWKNANALLRWPFDESGVTA